jgi:hypothetical protein
VRGSVLSRDTDKKDSDDESVDGPLTQAQDSSSVETALVEVLGAPKPAPTREDFEAGRIGNGQWPVGSFADPDYRAIAQRHAREKAIARKEGREEGFLEANKDMLVSAAKIREQALRLGDMIADKMLAGEEVSQAEVQVWKKALDEARRAEERIMGKAVAKTETHQSGGFLGLVINRDVR